MSSGFVYVIMFSDSSIKVGRSADPVTRFARHREESARYGMFIRSFWATETLDMEATEVALILWCIDHGKLRPRTKEFFTSIPFQDCIEAAQSFVNMPRVDLPNDPEDDQEDREDDQGAPRETSDEMILNLMSTGSSWSTEKIGAGTQLSRATIYRSLRRLERSGAITKILKGRWVVTPDGT